MNQQAPNQQFPPANAQPAPLGQPGPAPVAAKRSGMAIASLVLGIVAAALSWMPIVNNLAFLVGLVGLALGIVGIVGCMRKGKGGKGLAIAGTVLSVVALVVVLATQAAYTAAIDEALQGSTVQQTSGGSEAASSEGGVASGSQASGSEDLAVGTSATLSDGLVVSVDAVQTGIAKYDGSPATGITVTYVNNGSKEASFNPYDWKCQDADGAQRTQTYLGNGSDELSSGSLAPGGTVTGNIYFDGDVVKALYYSNMLNSKPTASWAL